MGTQLLERAQSRTTQSRLELWWLCTIRGYRIDYVSLAPKWELLGKIVYARTWVLRTPKH